MKMIRSDKWLVYTGICLMLNFSCFSQKSTEKKEKYKATHSLGLYGGGGFNHLSEPKYSVANMKNKVLDFGFFYSCSFRPTVKLRVGVEGTYLYGDRTYSSSYRTKSKSLHVAVPIQFQYVFNPDNRVQVYFGLGLSLSRWLNTEGTTYYDEGTSNYSSQNKQSGIDVMPIALVGLNAKIGNNFSIFLQPEYRPMVIDAKKNVRLRSLIVQLGVTYQFNQTKREKK